MRQFGRLKGDGVWLEGWKVYGVIVNLGTRKILAWECMRKLHGLET